MKRKKVYICSPLRGDMEENIRKARVYCRQAVVMGVLPIAPHIYFTQFMDDTDPRERKICLEMGCEELATCAETWVFGLENLSEGMAAEVELSELLGIPVLNGFEMISLLAPADQQGGASGGSYA